MTLLSPPLHIAATRLCKKKKMTKQVGEFQAIIIMPNSEGLANWWGF